MDVAVSGAAYLAIATLAVYAAVLNWRIRWLKTRVDWLVDDWNNRNKGTQP